MTPSLRSSAIAAVSTLPRTAPSFDGASLLLVGLAFRAWAFRLASPPKVPAVQRKSLRQDRAAASMPDAVWPVSRHRLEDWIPAQHHSPVSTSSEHFRHLNWRFTGVRLPVSYLTPLKRLFRNRFTTPAFDQSRLRWFATCSASRSRGTYPHLLAAACCGTLKSETHSMFGAGAWNWRLT